jgi:methylthioribose-1-phosphate isomerase
MPAGMPSPIQWTSDHGIRILDQTRLPQEEHYLEINHLSELAEAIRALRVRGAPLIGIAAAMGVAMVAGQQSSGAAGKSAGKRRSGEDGKQAMATVRAACELLAATRPTAVNLRWALDRMCRCAEVAVEAGNDLAATLVAEANAIWEEDRRMCARIGELGKSLFPPGATVCTVCNAGALATGGIGTALAPVYLQHQSGATPHVIVPETRPLLQGSRLTAWELNRAGIPVTVIADGMIASRLRRGDVRAVLVGADRIAANGDVANKIGTYGLALAAKAHGIPFYVAAPSSTIDPSTPSGAAIPIEERSPGEITTWQGSPSAPAHIEVWNPAFDVTPAELVTGIITDRGIFRPQDILDAPPQNFHREGTQDTKAKD